MAPKAAERALFAAIEAGDVPALEAALAEGASPNATKGKQSALEYALSQRHPDAVGVALISAGADVARARNHIVWAATQPVSVLETFLAAGAPVNAESFAGRPVQVAARAGLLPNVKALLAAGADPDAGTLIGNPLTDAIRNGHGECALELLRAGARPEAAERFGPLLPTLVELGEVALVRALLDHGARADGRYTLKGPHSRAKKAQAESARNGLARGLQALTRAVGDAIAGKDDEEDDGESFEDFEKRINAQLDAKVQEATRVRLSGVTPLMLAAREGSLELVEMLLARGADPDAVDDHGRTALAMAEAEGHPAVAEHLRARGARAVAAVSPAQALVLAAEQGDPAGIEEAVGRGAAVDAHDTRQSADGKTPLTLAAEGGHRAAVEKLIALGADLELKARTSPHNTRAILDSESQERTPLHVAAALGHDEVARLLLDAGASPKARDECRETPLHLAAAGNRASTVRLLLERGAEADAKGRDGMTPLLYAAARGHAEAGQALIDAGADARAATRAQESALHYAVSSNCLPLVRALWARGADPDARNKYGATPRERGAHVEAIAAMFDEPRPAAPGPGKPAGKKPSRRARRPPG
jgi:ankyrin repeat protein